MQTTVPSIPLVTLTDSPVLIQDSPEPRVQDNPIAEEARDLQQPASSLLANPQQIQVMSPTPQAHFGYEAVLTQQAMVERLTNQPYPSSTMYEDYADQRCSDAVASAPQHAENEIFRNSTRSAEDIPVPISNSNTSGQATPTVVRETIYREVVQSEAVVSAAASAMDPNPPGFIVGR